MAVVALQQALTELTQAEKILIESKEFEALELAPATTPALVNALDKLILAQVMPRVKRAVTLLKTCMKEIDRLIGQGNEELETAQALLRQAYITLDFQILREPDFSLSDAIRIIETAEKSCKKFEKVLNLSIPSLN